MKKFFNFIKFLLFLFFFISCKILSYNININNMILFHIIELLLIFILIFVFSIITDFSINEFKEKIRINLIFSFIIIIIIIILTFIKIYKNNSNLIISMINYLIFLSISLIPLIRDKFYYQDYNKNSFILNISYIFLFIFFKFIFNLINLFILNNNNIDLNILNNFFIIIFCIFLYCLRPFIFSFFVKGFVEYDSKEYPIFETFKVGRNKTSNIIIDNSEPKKSTFFSLKTGKKWFVKPNTPIKINNQIITEKKEIDDGDTINCLNNYFTIIKSKGSFFKRFFILFTYIFLLTIQLFSYDENNYDEPEKIIIENIDFSMFPEISIYISDSDLIKKIEDNIELNKDNFFLIEDNNKAEIKEIEYSERPIDLVFILDITGSMFEEYLKIQKDLKNFSYNLKKVRKKVRFGIITFADLQENMQIINLSEDTDNVIYCLSKIEPEAGGDYKENPYDAIFKLESFNFLPGSQKVVILITDAPPHIKGDKANKGKDFTSKTTDDVIKFLSGSSFLFYIVSCERFEEYQKIIDYNLDKFFDIEKYENFSQIIYDIEKNIKNQIKIKFNSKKTIDFYLKSGKNKVILYKDKNAKKAKEYFEIKIIKKTSFFNSLFDIF